MNAAGTSAVARIAGAVLVLAIAAALGLAVGNALNQRSDESSAAPGPNIGGFVPANQGGTTAGSRTAQAVFSLEAIQALNAIRGDEVAAAAVEPYADFGLRHPQQVRESFSTQDYANLHDPGEANSESFSTQMYADLHDATDAAGDRDSLVAPTPR